MMLQRLSSKVLVLSMKGYIFFGSSVLLLRDAKKALRIKEAPMGPFDAPSLPTASTTSNANPSSSSSSSSSSTTYGVVTASDSDGDSDHSASKSSSGRFSSQTACLTPVSNRGGVIPAHYANAAAATTTTTNVVVSPVSGGGGGGRIIDKSATLDDSELEFFAKSFQRNNSSYQAVDGSNPLETLSENNATADMMEKGKKKSGGGHRTEPPKPPTPPLRPVASPGSSPSEVEVAILDFTKVIGLDASAARSCFLMLKQVICFCVCVFFFFFLFFFFTKYLSTNI
jgi:hypothetical protein